MTKEERREEILSLLEQADAPHRFCPQQPFG